MNTPEQHDSADARPPEALIAHLPTAGSFQCQGATAPLAVIPDDRLATVVADGQLTQTAALVAEERPHAASCINALIELGLFQDAMSVLAWTLPKRAGLWWAFRCTWDMMLERDRTRAIAAHDLALQKELSVETPAGKPPVPKAEAPKEMQDLQAMAEGDTGADHAALQAEVQQACTALLNMMQARTGGLSSPQTETQIATAQGALDTVRSDTSGLTAHLSRPKKPAIAVAPSGTPSGAPLPKPKAKAPAPELPESIRALQAKIHRRTVNGHLRGMASCLQWIIDPCQEHAEAAADALPSLTKAPSANALAKATFWCGENLSRDPQKPQVPPPATLPLKGIAVALTKAMQIKGCSWSKQDTLHWFVHRGLDIATGTLPWDNALPQFDMYVEWKLKHLDQPEA